MNDKYKINSFNYQLTTVTKKEDPENPQQWREFPRTLALVI